jgi:hypothetical protein
MPGTRRVETHHREPRQLITDTAWIEVVQAGLRTWRDEAAKRLQTLAPGR